MASYSDPIAIAAATATVFDLPAPRTSVRVGVIFYSTSDAEAGDEVAAGSGTRDIEVSAVVPLEGLAVYTMPIVGASVSANPAWSMKPLDLGSPLARISVSCAAATDPGTATHYRIIVD